jgi:outer membrane protein assembly factor BamB
LVKATELLETVGRSGIETQEVRAMRGFAWAGGLVLGVGLLLTGRAEAVITRIFPLREVFKDEHIFMAKVEKLDPDRPAMLLKVVEDLKGKTPFDKMPVNLTGDKEGQKEKHTAQLLKRLAADVPLIFFTSPRGTRYTTFGYTNGTWFQLIGHADKDDPSAVRWGFMHCEPYLRRTFKGTTAELRQVVVDGLKGVKEPPEPDATEKPGLGPELKSATPPKDKGEKQGLRPSAGGPLFAVIPTFVVLGPLALLAALFPAVFGGLALVLKRWLVLLTVASVNSTLYMLHGWFYPSIKHFWWGTPVALWAAMALLTLAGAVWSWRRHRARLREAPDPAAVLPGRKEQVILWGLSLVGVAVVVYCLLKRTLDDRPWKDLAVVWIALWIGTLYSAALRLMARRRPGAKAVLATEGVVLGALALGCVALGATLWPRHTVQTFSNGEVVWTFEAGGSGLIVSSPVVAGDRVYVAAAQNQGFSTYGTLYCLDRATKEVLWTFNNDDDMKQVSVSSPCLADGRLYIGEGFHQDKDCKLYCLDAATGKKLWEFETESHTESTPCVADGKVFFGAGDDGVYCLDAKTGERVWHFEGLHVDSKLAVAGKRLYAGSGVGDRFNATKIFCLDADTGEAEWESAVDLPVWGSPTVAGSFVYFPLGNGNFVQSAEKKPAGALLCVRAQDGQRWWRYDVPDGVLVQPAVDDEAVYFVSRDRHCYCVDRQEGKFRWKHDLGSPVVAAPALAGSSLYVVASEGRVACLNATTGEPRWTFDVAAHSRAKPQLLSSPTVAADPGPGGRRRLYFGAGLDDIGMTPTLYCLEEQTAPLTVAVGR